ncbi:MAG: MaoC family dehydratase N-terminal domain-containing protein [Candidatus Hydrogenedentes bacterium]|nr:MaoC family dehydratase N-terminal domain-containing protein [Candidatus Hydrogenedentota bacterium]
MELSSKYVGKRSRPCVVTITPRQSMAYAAGVGDANPLYFDDERADGVIAPPMLAVSLTWQLASRFAEFWDVGDFPTEVLAQQVHYSEALEWHHPMAPGSTLTITGEVAAILPHRAGTHMVLRFTAADSRGATIFREYIGGMMRGVRCADGGAGIPGVPQAAPWNGEREVLWEKRLRIDPLAPWIYDMCGDVPFPIHTSRAFARAVGLQNVIYQGTATLALALRELTNEEASADPRRVRGLACHFTGMVEPGTEITVRALGKETTPDAVRVYFQVLNEKNHKAIRNGSVTFGVAGYSIGAAQSE